MNATWYQAARQLAPLLAAFGSRVIGYDPAVHQNDPVWASWGVEPLGWQEVMSQSDAVVVLLPLYERYRGLFDGRKLAAAKPGQVLVSLAHSALFDERALAEALRGGGLLAAWFDSLEPGWLEPGRPLYGAAALQVTPRLAATTRESRARAAWGVARRIDELLSQPLIPRERINPAGARVVPSSGPRSR
jgi:phosphoglycerate dehydrogenase-like enzyme